MLEEKDLPAVAEKGAPAPILEEKGAPVPEPLFDDIAPEDK